MSWIKEMGGLVHRGKEVSIIGSVLQEGKIYLKVHLIDDNRDIHIWPEWLEEEKTIPETIGNTIKKRNKTKAIPAVADGVKRKRGRPRKIR